MDASAILEVATHFRIAIETLPIEERIVNLRSFPKGACGDASLLLGAYFSDQGIVGFNYVTGERGEVDVGTWTSHAWLRRGDLIVDITADQFPESPMAIIVSQRSTLHDSFQVVRQDIADFRQWSGYGAEILYPMYSRILGVLQSTRQ
ncbi:hypothetical protein [Chromobacterium sinusclupearum]|uniref:hypothetical protein n=1 Tax=Chromobacterium sinusclupearum TaxID=2077146 RepID=UPI0011AF58F4|nr:hypothetical protein [Chromobacterium sinusclupearum]